MKNILKFIYNREDNGIYRIRTVLGIKITTKPKELQYNIIITDTVENNKIIGLKKSGYSENKNKLAIFIRFGIGDYMLFRKFLPYIRNFYKDYSITLIGNSLHKDITKDFDIAFIDEYIEYQGYNIYQKDFEDYFSSIEYDILISHFYGRTWDIDNIISCINAKEKITSYGSLWHSSSY